MGAELHLRTTSTRRTQKDDTKEHEKRSSDSPSPRRIARTHAREARMRSTVASYGRPFLTCGPLGYLARGGESCVRLYATGFVATKTCIVRFEDWRQKSTQMLHRCGLESGHAESLEGCRFLGRAPSGNAWHPLCNLAILANKKSISKWIFNVKNVKP